MKRTRIKIIGLTALALTAGGFANAQSNKVPGPADYAAFSQFVTERNIFDPNRQPHYTGTRTTRIRTQRTRTAPSAPAFSLVGTMSYEKGLFAFFNGNSEELKKALPVSDKIAGYTVVAIAPGRVLLESTNRQEKLVLKVGDVMRLEGSKWELSGTGDLPAGIGSPAAASPTGGDSPPPAPSPALGQSDVLKRLMELRAKENQ
jgi:hypothetical protein